MNKSKGASPRRTPAFWPESARKRARARGVFTCRRGDLGEAAFVHEAIRLGFVVARPYGQGRRYDFMVEGGHKLWRVQVKTCGTLRHGLYHVNVRCKTNRVGHAYAASDVDFVAVYILREKTWYILPIDAVAGRAALRFRPEGYAGPDVYAEYREAWHLMGEPDGPSL
jgi:hypothetical protein